MPGNLTLNFAVHDDALTPENNLARRSPFDNDFSTGFSVLPTFDNGTHVVQLANASVVYNLTGGLQRTECAALSNETADAPASSPTQYGSTRVSILPDAPWSCDFVKVTACITYGGHTACAVDVITVVRVVTVETTFAPSSGGGNVTTLYHTPCLESYEAADVVSTATRSDGATGPWTNEMAYASSNETCASVTNSTLVAHTEGQASVGESYYEIVDHELVNASGVVFLGATAYVVDEDQSANYSFTGNWSLANVSTVNLIRDHHEPHTLVLTYTTPKGATHVIDVNNLTNPSAVIEFESMRPDKISIDNHSTITLHDNHFARVKLYASGTCFKWTGVANPWANLVPDYGDIDLGTYPDQYGAPYLVDPPKAGSRRLGDDDEITTPVNLYVFANPTKETFLRSLQVDVVLPDVFTTVNGSWYDNPELNMTCDASVNVPGVAPAGSGIKDSQILGLTCSAQGLAPNATHLGIRLGHYAVTLVGAASAKIPEGQGVEGQGIVMQSDSASDITDPNRNISTTLDKPSDASICPVFVGGEDLIPENGDFPPTGAPTLAPTPAPFPAPTSSPAPDAYFFGLPIALGGGSTIYEGRVLVQVDGTWGVVCDDSWDTNDGDVVCKQLFGSTSYALSAPCCSSFGWDDDYDFVMDDVACSGSESELQTCSYSGSDNCGATEGAGVVCSPPTEVSSGTVALEGGTTSFEGRVLVQVDGTWGVVCDDSWDTTDGDVVCKQLFGSGSYALSAPCCSSFGWDSNYNFVMDNVACSGSESQLQTCSYSGSHNCGSSEGAGVVCSPVPDPTPRPSASPQPTSQPTAPQPTPAPVAYLAPSASPFPQPTPKPTSGAAWES